MRQFGLEKTIDNELIASGKAVDGVEVTQLEATPVSEPIRHTTARGCANEW